MSIALSAICWFEGRGLGDIASVRGKNASPGEMIRQLHSQGIRVLAARQRVARPEAGA